ncbi:hypothetical protein C4D60_Mb04t22780 [Musa balbisiana]|uniref:Methyltransferase type 12 domain-containing protein n=1 Tax=Musa balbisiana TaxID=52838 RepID=A0A4S8KE13_MUSBA|nr:hypothetical protein C4D60_Mb04t22780 [Musa balbisiana]
MATPPSRGITVPASLLILTAAAAFLLFLLLPSLSPSSSNAPSLSCPTTAAAAPAAVAATTRPPDPISPTPDDIAWLKSQLARNSIQEPPSSPAAWHSLRKGINPRTRAQQLEDLRRFKGVSHYEGDDASNHTALPCPGELLVEEHHSNYGEPWAGGRDVFEFLAAAARLAPADHVLEIGCGTLRVGLHFIRYLDAARFHCLERDELSLMAALRYELPSQGLLHKRPLVLRGEDMEFDRFGSDVVYDLIYASAVFLHMPDALVWEGLERLSGRLKPEKGRIFVSHNIKFCSRLGGDVCTERLSKLGLEYVGKHTHDSLLFSHYEIWFEFRKMA